MQVHAEVVEPDAGTQATTNTFQFTFAVPGEQAPTVLPRSYAGPCTHLPGLAAERKQTGRLQTGCCTSMGSATLTRPFDSGTADDAPNVPSTRHPFSELYFWQASFYGFEKLRSA